MKTTVYDWELHQGAAVDLLIPVAGLPTTGVGVRCHIRDSVDAVAPRLILAHDNPVNRRVTVSAEGIRIQIGATVTGGLQMAQPRNLWGYDVEVYSLTDADDVLKPRAGTIYAYREWTREADTIAMPPLASGDGRYLRIDGDQGLTPEQQAWAQHNSNTGPGGPGGASDHGALTGLADDDHPQYHTDARGDARYDAIGAAAGAVSAHAAAPSAHSISGVDGLTAALALLAPLASPALTGTPTAPTALAGTASTQLATTAFVAAAIAALLNSAPGALDTLDELAAALGDDPNFATTVTNALAGKLAKASNLSDLTDAAAARTNLGAGAVGAAVFQAATAAAIRTLLELGGAALLNVGTGAGTAAAGDHLHTGVYAAAAHNHALGDITQSGATSGQVATWNGSAWVPQTPSGASPGGSGSELQYRGGASTFSAAAGTHWDAVNGRLSIGAGTSPAGMLHAQASAASVIPAVLQGAASQTAPLQRWTDNAGATVAALNQTKSIELYNVDGANYERLDIKWLSNVAVLDVTKSGSGTQRAFSLRYSGSEAIGVATSGIVSIAYLQIVGQTIDFTGLGTLVGFRYQYASSSLVTYNPIQNLDYGRFYIATSASDQAWTHRSSPSSGTWLGIKVGSAKAGSYIRLNAASGQKIRIASGVSATGGYVRSNEAHAFLLMVWDSTEGEWVAWQQGGTWTIDS